MSVAVTSPHLGAASHLCLPFPHLTLKISHLLSLLFSSDSDRVDAIEEAQGFNPEENCAH